MKEIRGPKAVVMILILGALLILSGFFFTFSLILFFHKSFIPSTAAVIACFAFSGLVVYKVLKYMKREERKEPKDLHKGRLKEAWEAYTTNVKKFKKGKISKEELKETLRPYKYELRELGFPVKIKDDVPVDSTSGNEK
jgi:hypothetical protein